MHAHESCFGLANPDENIIFGETTTDTAAQVDKFVYYLNCLNQNNTTVTPYNDFSRYADSLFFDGLLRSGLPDMDIPCGTKWQLVQLAGSLLHSIPTTTSKWQLHVGDFIISMKTEQSTTDFMFSGIHQSMSTRAVMDMIPYKQTNNRKVDNRLTVKIMTGYSMLTCTRSIYYETVLSLVTQKLCGQTLRALFFCMAKWLSNFWQKWYTENEQAITKRQKHASVDQHNITVAYKPANTLRKTLSRPKGKLDPMTRNNVIYRIQCKDCDKRYIGQTGRKLSTRIHEHKLATERHDQFSLISLHKDQEGHEFDWSGVHILGQARTKKEREFIEAWYSTKGSINKHIEIDPIYQQLRARKKHPPNCALMMSPRMVTKRLQANCQARRTDQQPPDQQPMIDEFGQLELHSPQSD
ncbi:hypothetical protein CLF_104301 [Clonorchis sinensis]|uniref:GIY-YIG domain-containing protein n=1 Tax=Clonorchis sinensis TaxID=79923 RepID=G7YBC8_CLOSI|nr:hypothetical protein CLF_104301 [Clonorchis sinensis]